MKDTTIRDDSPIDPDCGRRPFRGDTQAPTTRGVFVVPGSQHPPRHRKARVLSDTSDTPIQGNRFAVFYDCGTRSG